MTETEHRLTALETHVQWIKWFVGANTIMLIGLVSKVVLGV